MRSKLLAGVALAALLSFSTVVDSQAQVRDAVPEPKKWVNFYKDNSDGGPMALDILRDGNNYLIMGTKYAEYNQEFILKTDLSGNIISQRNYGFGVNHIGNSSANDFKRSLEDGHLYVASRIVTGNKGFIYSFDENDNLKFAKTYSIPGAGQSDLTYFLDMILEEGSSSHIIAGNQINHDYQFNNERYKILFAKFNKDTGALTTAKAFKGASQSSILHLELTNYIYTSNIAKPVGEKDALLFGGVQDNNMFGALLFNINKRNQNVLWSKAYTAENKSNTTVADVIKTLDDSYVAVGQYIDFNAPEGGTAYESYLFKVDRAGNVKWHLNFHDTTNPAGGIISGIFLDSVNETSDGFYVASGRLLIEDGTQTNFAGVFQVKVDKGGTIVWQKTYDVPTLYKTEMLTAPGGGQVTLTRTQISNPQDVQFSLMGTDSDGNTETCFMASEIVDIRNDIPLTAQPFPIVSENINFVSEDLQLHDPTVEPVTVNSDCPL